jgi:TonB dependent receptor/Carboxypeptidase regulatory-like domain/TonB-dependent Receptor Plug Domain
MPRGGESFAGLSIFLCLLAGGIPAPAAAGGAAWRADPGAAEAKDFRAGMPLTEALLELQARGMKLVFSSAVVRAEMTVRSKPASQDPRSILDELLAPHGLGVQEGPGGILVVISGAGVPLPSTLHGSVRSRVAQTPLAGVSVAVLGSGREAVTGADGRFAIEGLEPGSYTVQARRPGFVIGERENVTLPPGGAVDVSFVLQPAPLTREDIVVHPSRITVLQEEPAAPFAMDREQVLRLPHLGGDVFRTLSLLPGTASNDITAQFYVRGGRRDEVRVLLDGQELYDAYHLKEFDNALSVIAASNLASLDLTTGAFPSRYGDRMGGILDLSTITPSRSRRFLLSLSVLNAQIEGSGTISERASWLASVRRGNTDLAGRLFGREDPSFWDVFGKLDYRPTSRHSVRLNLLHSSDELDFVEEENEELTRFDTDYTSSYAWLTHQAVASDRLFVDTALSASRIDRDRRGQEDEEEKQLDVRDERELQVTGLSQSWNVQAGARHFLKAGWEVRRFQADYDYSSFRAFTSPLVELRSEPRDGVFDFRDRSKDEYLGAYFSDRFAALEPLTLELGVRYDRHTLTDDSVWSPRVNLAWRLGRSSVARLGWGHYYQSQRAYELAVEDADTRFYPAERSEHWVAGFEHRFDGAASNPLAALRAEVYRRRVTDPRPRYENLLEPFQPLPEGAFDRHRIEPEGAVAQGFEVFLQGRAGSRVDWWVNYGRAESRDEIEGADVPRQIEQRDTVNVDVNYHLGRNWDVNFAWRYHTGWRITPVSLEEADGELLPVLGPLNSDRLPDYHRLDLRVSRKWPTKSGFLAVFVDAQNVYNRKNVAGFDLEIDEEAGEIIANEERWPGFFASAGVSLEF